MTPEEQKLIDKATEALKRLEELQDGKPVKKQKLDYYGGSGHESYPYRFGKFEVKSGNDDKTKVFHSLDKAVEYFDMIHDEKALWDSQRCELIDAYHWVDVDENGNDINEEELPF